MRSLVSLAPDFGISTLRGLKRQRKVRYGRYIGCLCEGQPESDYGVDMSASSDHCRLCNSHE